MRWATKEQLAPVKDDFIEVDRPAFMHNDMPYVCRATRFDTLDEVHRFIRMYSKFIALFIPHPVTMQSTSSLQTTTEADGIEGFAIRWARLNTSFSVEAPDTLDRPVDS